MTHSFPTRRASELSVERRRRSVEPYGVAVDHEEGLHAELRQRLRDPAAGFEQHRLLRQQDAPPACEVPLDQLGLVRSEEHTSELQSLMRISYAVFCLQKKTHIYASGRGSKQ